MANFRHVSFYWLGNGHDLGLVFMLGKAWAKFIAGPMRGLGIHKNACQIFQNGEVGEPQVETCNKILEFDHRQRIFGQYNRFLPNKGPSRPCVGVLCTYPE